MSKPSDDLEAGSPLLYPSMQENPEYRWAFIRKVYSILTLQLLATFGFAALVVAVQPVATFFRGPAGFTIYILVLVLAIVGKANVGYTSLSCNISLLLQRHPPMELRPPGNLTLCFGFLVGLAASFTTAQVLAEAVLATMAVVIALTIYTFWAAKRGEDFSFLIPFLISILVIFLMFVVFQLFYPMGKVTDIICSGVCVLIFSAYIIFDTYSLTTRFSYDDYIWASLCLYSDVLRLFVLLLNIFRATNE